jgi:hypothetical protein
MKRPKKQRTESARAMATRLKCSRQLIDRLRRRGHSDVEIAARVRERQAREAAKLEPVLPADLPALSVPTVDGHGNNGFPTFASSQREKEYWLCQLRAHQVQLAKADALPVEPWRALTTQVVRFQCDCLRRWPEDVAGEIAMRPQHECAEVLRVRVEHLFRSTESYLEAECRKYNIRLGPPPPDEPRLRLAYYERYARDSKCGAVEVIPVDERFESAEWYRKHPSIANDPQKWFAVKRAKAKWDEEMAQLLKRRVEWDLPDEEVVGDEQPEEPPEPKETA